MNQVLAGENTEMREEAERRKYGGKINYIQGAVKFIEDVPTRWKYYIKGGLKDKNGIDSVSILFEAPGAMTHSSFRKRNLKPYQVSFHIPYSSLTPFLRERVEKTKRLKWQGGNSAMTIDLLMAIFAINK